MAEESNGPQAAPQPPSNGNAPLTKNSTISIALVVILVGVFALAAERVTSLEVNLSSIKESQRKTEEKLETFATSNDIERLQREIATLSATVDSFASRDDVEMIVEAKIAKVVQDVYKQQAAGIERVEKIIREELRKKEGANK